MKPDLVKNCFNILTAEYDPITIPKERIFALLSTNNLNTFQYMYFSRTPSGGLGMKKENIINAPKHGVVALQSVHKNKTTTWEKRRS